MRCSSNFIHPNSHACPPRDEKWRRQKRNKKEETGAFAQLLMGLLNLNNSALKKILRLWVWTRTHTHTVLRMNLLCSAATANVLPRWTRIDSCYAFHVKNLLFLFLLHQFHIISQQCKNQWPVCTNECGHLLPVYHSSIRLQPKFLQHPSNFFSGIIIFHSDVTDDVRVESFSFFGLALLHFPVRPWQTCREIW